MKNNLNNSINGNNRNNSNSSVNRNDNTINRNNSTASSTTSTKISSLMEALQKATSSTGINNNSGSNINNNNFNIFDAHSLQQQQQHRQQNIINHAAMSNALNHINNGTRVNNSFISHNDILMRASGHVNNIDTMKMGALLQQQQQQQQQQQHLILPPITNADLSNPNKTDINTNDNKNNDSIKVDNMNGKQKEINKNDNTNRKKQESAKTTPKRKKASSKKVNNQSNKKSKKLMPSLPTISTDYSQQQQHQYQQNIQMNNEQYQQQPKQQKMLTIKERFDIPLLPSAPKTTTTNNNQSTTTTTMTAPYFVNLPPNETSTIPLKKRSKMSHTSGSSRGTSSASSSIFSSLPPRLQENKPFIKHMIHHHHYPNKIVLNKNNKKGIGTTSTFNDAVSVGSKMKQQKLIAPSSPVTTNTDTSMSNTTIENKNNIETFTTQNNKNNGMPTTKISTALNHYKSECTSILKRCLVLAGYNANENENEKSEDMLTFYFAARAIYDDIQRWKRLKSFFVQCQEMKENVALSKKQQQQKDASNTNNAGALGEPSLNNNSINNLDASITIVNNPIDNAQFSDATTKASVSTSLSTSIHDPSHLAVNNANILLASDIKYPNPTATNMNNTPLHLLSTNALLLSAANNNNSNYNISNQDREGDLSSINNETVTTVTTKDSTNKDKETVNSEFTKQLEDIDTVSEISNFDTISELESKNSFLGRFRNVTSSVLQNDNKSNGSGNKSNFSGNKSSGSNSLMKGNNLNASISSRSNRMKSVTAASSANKQLLKNNKNQENSVSSSILQWDGDTNTSNEMSTKSGTSSSKKNASKDNCDASNASSKEKSNGSIDHRAQEWKSEFLSMIEDHGDTILSDLMTFSNA